MSKPKNMVRIGTTCTSPHAAKITITAEARELCERKGLMVWNNSCVQISETHWRCDYFDWFSSDDNIWDEMQDKIKIGIVESIDDVLRPGILL